MPHNVQKAAARLCHLAPDSTPFLPLYCGPLGLEPCIGRLASMPTCPFAPVTTARARVITLP